MKPLNVLGKMVKLILGYLLDLDKIREENVYIMIMILYRMEQAEKKRKLIKHTYYFFYNKIL